jgi:hypothetical protein
VTSVVPVVVERYRVTVDEHETEATATLGVDVPGGHLADRVIAGRYLSGPDADEVLLHEYLAYQWGYREESRLEELVGRTIALEALGGPQNPLGISAGDVAGMLSRLDLSALTEEERAAIPRIAAKLMKARAAEAGRRRRSRRTLTIVGVVREMEPGDAFRVIEDGNSWQVDVFLPSETARELYLASPLNREIGYRRALVTVDEARHTKAVETNLRDRGFTAYSVASVLDRIEGATSPPSRSSSRSSRASRSWSPRSAS